MEIGKITPSRPVISSVERSTGQSIKPTGEQQKSVQTEIRGKEESITKEELKDTVDVLNKFLEPSNTNLKFQFHEKLNKFYVTVINTETNETIKEIPPKKILDIYAFMLESIGLIVDHRL